MNSANGSDSTSGRSNWVRSRRLPCRALLALCLGIAFGAEAANGTWNGTTSALWSLAGNWSASPAPGTGNTATFNNAGNARTALDLTGGLTISTILFDTASVAAYTIGSGAVGSQTLILNNGGTITANSTINQNQLFNAAITLGTDATAQSYTITDSSTTKSLTFAGNISGGSTGTAGTKTLTVSTAAGGVAISGNLGNGGATAVALTKSGAGTLTLSGANTYSGATTVQGGGKLTVNGTGTIAPTTGATLAIGASSTSGTFQYDSSGTSKFGGITVGNGTTAPGTFNQTAGTITATSLTLNNGYSGNGPGTLSLSGGTLTVSGVTTISSQTSGDNVLSTFTISGSAILNANGGLRLTGLPASGRNADGKFVQTAGTVNVAGGLLLVQGTSGNTAIRRGEYDLNGGTLNVNGISSTSTGASDAVATFILNGGILKATTDNVSFWPNNAQTTAQIKSGGAIIDDGGFAITLGQSLGEDAAGRTLTKQGGGTLILSGANTYSGATTIQVGKLVGQTGGSCASSAVAVTPTSGVGTLGVQYTGANAQWSCASLTFNSGGTGTGWAFGFTTTPSSTTAPLSISDTVVFNVTPTVTVAPANLVSGAAYPLLVVGGTPPVTGTPTTVTIGRGLTGTLAWGAAGFSSKTLVLTVSGTSAEPLSWNTGATGSGTWDINNAANPIWKDAAANSTYYQESILGILGDQVLFDDSSSHITANTTVTLNSVVNPASVTVNNSSYTYSISGTGTIIGSASLSKSGGSTLTLSTVNTFTGDTTISAGTLTIGGAGKLGAGSYAGAIANSGAFIYNSSAAQTLSGGISGVGTLAQSAGTLTLSGNDTYTGSTSVSGGTFKLGAAGALGNGTLNTSGVTVSGSGIFDFGGITPTYPAPITLNSSANGFDIGAFENSGASAVTFGGSITLQQQTRFGGTGDLLLTGSMTGNGVKFIKDSTGLLELQNSGTVTLGAFQANRGTLQVDSGSTLNFTSLDVGTGSSVGAGLTLNGGAVIVSSSATTVRFGQGSGTASGTLTLNSGTLTAPFITKGSLTFNVNFNGGTLKANAASGTFLASATSALVKSGGAVIDDGGFAITIGQALAHDPALGATADGGLTKSGTGTLTLSGPNTYSGDTTLSAGILNAGVAQIGTTSGPLGAGGKIIFGGGTLQFSAASSSWDPSPRIAAGTSASGISIDTAGQNINFGTGLTASQSGGLAKLGAGTLALSVANAFSGDTLVSGGTLSLAHNLALQNSTFDTAGAGTLFLDPAVITPSFGGLKGSTALTLPATVASLTLNLGVSQSPSYAGALDGGSSHAMALTKVGLGTQTLSGANLYSGATTIIGGTLSLGSSGSISNTPSITVASGAMFDVTNLTAGAFVLLPNQTLRGNGTVMGNVIVDGTLAAGESIGTLTNLGNVTWAPGGTDVVEIGGMGSTPGVDCDFLSIGGELNITVTNGAPAANKFTIKLVASGAITGFGTASNFWPIATATNGVFGFNAGDKGKFNMDLTGFTNNNNLAGGRISLELMDSNVVVRFTPASAPCDYTTTNWFNLQVIVNDPAPNTTNVVMTFSNASYLTSVQALTLSNCTLTGTAYDIDNNLLPTIDAITRTNRTALPANTVKLVLTAVKVDFGKSAAVNALVIDTCGRGKSFDPVITTLAVTSGNRVTQRFEGLLSAEHYLRVLNATPGLKWLEIDLNGRVFRLDPLADGQDVSADLWSAMHEGDNNVVILTGGGDVGASAFVTITDTATDGMVALPEIVSLTLNHTADGLVLGWPDTLTGWELQSSTDTSSGWAAVTTTPVVANSQFTVTVPTTGGAQFYRLANPAAAANVTAKNDRESQANVSVPNPQNSATIQRTYDGLLW